MTHTSLIKERSQAGFTLVELAIVMIIIGLLIGGVLKGQELIGNAQIAATSSQVKAYEAATTTFQDIYSALPGDMPNAAARIPNCAAAAECTPGAGTPGNNRVEGAGVAGVQAAGNEETSFWSHLALADLIGGVDPLTGGLTFGGLFPTAEVAGGFSVGYHAGGALGDNANAVPAHYLYLSSDPAAPADDALSANQAARLDRKLDDGVPVTGSVFSSGGTCDLANVYDEANTAAVCDLILRLR